MSEEQEPNQFYCVVIKKEDELEDGYHDNSVPEFTGNAVSPDTLSQTLKSEEVSCVSIGPEPNKPDEITFIGKTRGNK
ncbi:hypothetical protein NDU88_003409 [Pleurodeles waltl]|uniref:Uncharacterized protein n=1 Tax=Pleurodeles waltl TaxID=8319 RepID=A0AAV7Q9C1_PLEWA|nr:hypothetical protein NDU88_003409 [Pleurodeles waltl]